jgi:hypothetical protein
MTSRSTKHRKACEVTSFPPMFLERIHTTTSMPMRKETLIHQNLCLNVSGYLDIHWAYSMNAEP